MLMVVSCPKCEKQSNVPETNLGRRIRCAGCQAIFLVSHESGGPPLPPPPRKVAPPPIPRHGPGDEPNEPIYGAAPEPLEPRAPPTRLGYWAARILIGLLMVGGGIFAAVYLKK